MTQISATRRVQHIVAGSDIMQGSAVRPLSLPPMPPRLSDLEIQRALGALPGWSRRRNVLTKTFTWPTFAQGIEFVARVATQADAMNHHPDIDIRYTKVTCALSTHDAGGITELDLKLAGEIERVAAE
jgi:4a-hydroxytetrahydrobiopterin dehydratase